MSYSTSYIRFCFFTGTSTVVPTIVYLREKHFRFMSMYLCMYEYYLYEHRCTSTSTTVTSKQYSEEKSCKDLVLLLVPGVQVQVRCCTIVLETDRYFRSSQKSEVSDERRNRFVRILFAVVLVLVPGTNSSYSHFPETRAHSKQLSVATNQTCGKSCALRVSCSPQLAHALTPHSSQPELGSCHLQPQPSSHRLLSWHLTRPPAMPKDSETTILATLILKLKCSTTVPEAAAAATTTLALAVCWCVASLGIRPPTNFPSLPSVS